ncbi:MAG TPA: Ni/Fe-hydrogenase, b-type cytochrome subunit [Gemmatimonadales bacterium]
MTTPVAAPSGVMAPQKPGYRWVYVWHWPLRAMHWIAAGAIVVLVITGLYIGKPYFMTTGDSDHFLMGWIRFLHFSAAGVLVATGILRVYGLFVGNRYERWSALFPIKPRDWVNTFLVIRKYLFILPEKTPHFLGHNPLQQFSYTGVYALALFQVVSGFTLYGQASPGGLFDTTFGWVAPLMGGMQTVRFLHHVCTWAFLIFLPIHVHFALRADRFHKHPSLPAIISGGRFVRDDATYEDE